MPVRRTSTVSYVAATCFLRRTGGAVPCSYTTRTCAIPRPIPTCPRSILHDIVNYKDEAHVRLAQNLGRWSYDMGPGTVGASACAPTNASQALFHKYRPVQQFEEVSTRRTLPHRCCCTDWLAANACLQGFRGHAVWRFG